MYAVRAHLRSLGVPFLVLPIAISLAVSGCGLKKKFEERAAEELAERLMEGAGGGEIDVEIDGEHVTVKDNEGKQIIDADGKSGKVVITDADGKTVTSVTDPDGKTKVTGSDGSELVAGHELPEDLPMELPALAKVEMAGRIKSGEDKGTTWTVTAISETKDTAALTEHFESRMKALGVEVQKNEMTGTATITTLLAEDKDKGLAVHVNLVKIKADDKDHPGQHLVQFVYRDEKAA